MDTFKDTFKLRVGASARKMLKAPAGARMINPLRAGGGKDAAVPSPLRSSTESFGTIGCFNYMGPSTKAIFGKRALYQLPAGDYIDWAGEMLVQGYDAASLRILAGLGRSTSTFEAEAYFLRAAKELGLRIPDPGAAVRTYACEIAQRIVDGQITGRDGVRALYRICLATEYDRDYLIWLELDDALDSLLSGQYAHTYESATLENFDEVAKREAEKFIIEMCGTAAT